MSTGSTPDDEGGPEGDAVGQQQSVLRVEELIRGELLDPSRVRQLPQIQVIGPGLPLAVQDTLARRAMAGLHDPGLSSPRQYDADYYRFQIRLVAALGSLSVVWGVATGVGAALAAEWSVTAVVKILLGVVLVPGALLGMRAAANWRLAQDPLYLSPTDQSEIRRVTQTVGWSKAALKNPPPEAAIVRVAQDIITGIRTSPVWADQSLDVHRIRLDLDEEQRQILTGAYRLSRFTAETLERGGQDGEGFDVDRLQAALDQRAGLTTAMRRALVERVAALYRYRDGLRPMETLLHDIELVRKLDAEQTELTAAYTDIVNNEQATAHLAELTAELTDLEAGLLARIDYLRTGVINNPALATPLAVSPATEGR